MLFTLLNSLNTSWMPGLHRLTPGKRPSLLLVGLAVLLAMVLSPAVAIRATAQEDVYERTQNVVYGEADGVGLLMDIFVPKGPSNGHAIVDVVSGSWHSGRGKLRDHERAEIFDIYCGRGYTVFAIRPGSVTKFNVPEMVDHAQQAIRWVKTHADAYGINPDELGLTGASAGGHLASLVAVESGRSTGAQAEDDAKEHDDSPVDASVKAVGVFFPPTDFLQYGATRVDPRDGSGIGALLKPLAFRDGFDGLSDAEVKRRLIAISPARRVTPNTPPFLLIHGTADLLVPQQQSETMLAALKKAGVPAQLMLKKGGGHPWPTIAEEVAVMADWFDGQLLYPQSTTPFYEAELVFPLHGEHNHAPGIVECPNGDLLVSWYRGSGERKADDVAVFGARRRKGQSEWSDAFLMADWPGFPDCNTCMMVDGDGRLWLFWPTILANSWESCLTNLKVSNDYAGDGAPKWQRQGMILLKPDDFRESALGVLDELVKKFEPLLTDSLRKEIVEVRERLGSKLYQRLGWQPRCKPTVLPSGRILLPLYTDTFSISIMAVSDDGGRSWYASKPLIGFGNIQPSVLRRNDGTLVAYMRENGPTGHIRISESTDEGLSWGPVGASELVNPGSGLDGVRLRDGNWCLVYNDLQDGRNRLAISLSDDEGKTWKWTRHLEDHPKGSYHYPAVIQSSDGRIHVVYSYFVDEGKSMKHATLNEAWIRQE